MVDFSDYQKRVGETDETGSQLVALFGAVSEVGSVLAVYKKKEREGLQNEQFQLDGFDLFVSPSTDTAPRSASLPSEPSQTSNREKNRRARACRCG